MIEIASEVKKNEFNFLHHDLFLFQKEMKNQCFGGEYLGEVFDHMLKR